MILKLLIAGNVACAALNFAGGSNAVASFNVAVATFLILNWVRP